MSEVAERCWSRIGVAGDSTCPRLAAAGHCRNCDEYARIGRTLFDREPSGALREEWARILAEPRENVRRMGDALIVFAIQDEYLAIPAASVERVTGEHPVHTLPSRTNAVFTGLVNMGGELLPCFSVAGVLELANETVPVPSRRMLLLGHRGIRLVCTVDRVLSITCVSSDDLEPPPVTLVRNARAFTTAVFPVGEKRAGLLDADKLIQQLMKSAGL